MSLRASRHGDRAGRAGLLAPARRVVALGLLIGAAAACGGAATHLALRNVAVAPRVERTSGDARDAVRVWVAYLTDPSRLATAKRYWAPDEVERLLPVDLAGSASYNRPGFAPGGPRGVKAYVVSVEPSAPPAEPGYVVTTSVNNRAMVRVYVVRDGGRWVLSNALVQETRGWAATRVGAITYLVQPGRAFDPADAARALQFTDSLADALGVPRLQRGTYVLARTPRDAMETLGVTGAGVSAARTYAATNLIVSGQGEFHAHELVHLVLAKWRRTGPRSRILTEGIATWVATTGSQAFEAMGRRLAADLREHPDLTLRDAFGEPAGAVATVAAEWRLYAGGAVLCQLVYERAGMAGIRRLLAAGPDYEGVTGAAARILGVAPAAVAEAWRQRVLAYEAP